jgi:hypothetical protein
VLRAVPVDRERLIRQGLRFGVVINRSLHARLL